MMDVEQLLSETRATVKADRVFAEPVQRNGVTVIPAARVSGGGGGGGDESEDGGSGAGFGLSARPAGALVIGEDGSVAWRPMVDVNKVILGGQVVAMVGILSLWLIARSRAKAAARASIAAAAINRVAAH
jgi:uncharacterized spore protein YtfJ